MKGIGILAMEWLFTIFIVYIGFTERQVLFIHGPRSAVITLGVIGFAMCMLMPTIGIFIKNAPAHPLTIAGYIFGVVALFISIAQIFKWRIPIIKDPNIALFIIAACIIIKSIIGRFAHVVVK